MDEFKNLNLTQLKKICKEKNIKNYSKMSKDDILKIISSNRLAPLLKWSGGKSDEIHLFEKYIPTDINYYIEPFCGAGSLFFYLNHYKNVINDVHKELIDFYNAIKDGYSQKIYDFMETHRNDEQTYYRVRDVINIADYIDNACRFYYLRKTCYRGMLRYNLNGKFNIPYGKYKTINYSAILNKSYYNLLSNTDVYNLNYSEIFEKYNHEKNFVFLDPPYDSIFTDYGYCKFDKQQHINLSNIFKSTKNRCLLVINKTDFICDLYKDYIVEEYDKNYRFRLYDGRIDKKDMDAVHLVIKNY